MAIVVETGEGLSTANSYATVAEADAYHAASGSSGWSRTRRGTATLTLRVQPLAAETLTVGSTTYAFVSGSPAVANDVRLGSTAAETAANLANAINYEGSPGAQYHASTVANPSAIAAVTSTSPHPVVTLTARSTTPGTVVVSDTIASQNVQLSGSIVTTDELEEALIRATRHLDAAFGGQWLGERTTRDQALDWPRYGVLDRDGYEVRRDELPDAVRNACCEAALESIRLGDLMPAVAPFGSGAIQSESITVGPISISESYVGGRSLRPLTPRVTALLRDLVTGASEVGRG